MVRLLQVMLRFYHHESCGQCTPCREGMGWLHRIIDRIVAGEGRARGHRAPDRDLAPNDGTTICGMGDAAGYATVGILAKFRRRVRVLHRARALALRRPLERRTTCECREIFIDGQPIQAETRPDRDAGGARAAASPSPYFCWHPALSVAGQLPHLRRAGREEAAAGWRSPATCRSTEGLRVLTDSDAVRALPQGDDAAHHAQPPGRLRHLRQGRRMHAAGLPLQVQRRAVGLARRQGARDQVPRALRAHRARQRALHPVLALRALHARDIEVERARNRSSAATTRWSAPPRTAPSTHDPYSDNVVDICPVGALLSRPFLYKSRVWYLEPTPSVCPGCARGCSVQIWHRKPEWKLNALDPRAERRASSA